MGKDTDSREDAHNKGEQDYSKSGGQANSKLFTEFFHPTYNPPSAHDEEHKSGWDNARKQDR